ATTLSASVRKTRVPTRRPVGVSRGICHVPISGAASAGVSGAGAGFVPAAPLAAGAAGLPAAGLVAWPGVESTVRAARAELLITNAASNKDVGTLRIMNDLLGTGKIRLNDCTCSCLTASDGAFRREKR